MKLAGSLCSQGGVVAAVMLLSSGFNQAGELPFLVTEPDGIERQNWPVTSGVPFGRGALWQSDSVRLQSEAGNQIPLQTEILSHWPDGSVRWLLLDFQVNLTPSQTRRFLLSYGPGIPQKTVANPVRVRRTSGGVELDTGRLRVELSEKSFRGLDAVWLDRNRDGNYSDDERLTQRQRAGIVLRTPDGTQFRADLAEAEITIEQTGPLRACVKISGEHAAAGSTMFRYIARVHAYRGQPYLKLCYTFVNNHKPKLMSRITALNLAFDTGLRNASTTIINGRPGGQAHLLQLDDRHYEIGGQAAGKRAPGWAAIANESGGIAIGVREFWQNWPKSIDVGDGLLQVGICPQLPTGRYDDKPIKEEAQLYYYLRDSEYAFKIGLSRTHELWATFLDGPADPQQLGQFFQAIDRPLLARPSLQYISSTRAAGQAPPADKSAVYGQYDLWLDRLFSQHLSDLDEIREYGMLNFGDWYNIKWDSWGNLEYDTARCFFTQYLRTGDRRYFDRGSQAARHYLDVDVVHEVNDLLHAFGGSQRMKPGHVWLHQVGHTGGYYGRYKNGKYHDEAPLIMKGPYQVGMYNWGHQWIGGVFDYYMLSGDRRALEVATLTADTIAADCPTHYSDHIRDLGWPLNLVIAAYEATGKQKYLDAATRQWRLLEEHLDPARGFQVMLAYGHCSEPGTAKRCRGQNAYMLGLTLSGLARYHRITDNPNALRGLTAGINQLIRECWSEQHKSFYLTSCTHNRSNPPPALCSVTALAAEAFAHEAIVTGNREHRRIFREAFHTMVRAGLESVARGDQHGQTGYSSMMFHFTPHALSILDD